MDFGADDGQAGAGEDVDDAAGTGVGEAEVVGLDEHQGALDGGASRVGGDVLEDAAVGVGITGPKFEVALGGDGVGGTQHGGLKVDDFARGVGDVVAVGVADVLPAGASGGDGSDGGAEFDHGVFTAEDQQQDARLGVGLVGDEILENVIADQLLEGVVPGLGVGDERRGVAFDQFFAGGIHPGADEIESGAGDET